MPKTGSTAIQRFARDNADYLRRRGFDFLPRNRNGSYNDLSVAMRSGDRARAAKLATMVRGMIDKSPAQTLVLSSEMLSEVDPAKLRELLALQEQTSVMIVGYFRRQSKYLASSYKQKLKTAKTKIGFENFIAKFGTGAGNYGHLVARWQAA
ncbi:hypothetical protein [Yoonia tamlensis]|uniref:hypothetical protein n=1 Tax=Yoonia tamlensis TaxID=390270 RepID=UPI000B7CC576|nr:hypothetical protein [Yoonia tamlensis]